MQNNGKNGQNGYFLVEAICIFHQQKSLSNANQTNG
jgi:hypothetical protein